MEFTCFRDDLVRGIATVEKAVATRETLSVLTGVLLEAATDHVRIAATDLELALECIIPAQVSIPGKTVLEGKYFIPLVRKLPDESVHLQWKPERQSMAITSGKAKAQINTLPAEDFPPLAKATGNSWLCDQGTLRKAIRQTAFSAADDHSRPFLSGLLVELNGAELCLVATDSSRLAFRRAQRLSNAGEEAVDEVAAEMEVLPVESPSNATFPPVVSAIVPTRAMMEVARLCVDEGATVEIIMGTNHMTVGWPQVTLSTRLIEGQFPNYQQVFVENQPTRIRVGRTALQNAVDRAALISKKGPPAVILVAENDTLMVSSREDEVGEVTEELPVVHAGSAIKVAYNAKYLSDMLRAVDVDEVEIHLGDPNRQGTFKAVGDDGYRYIIMPIRM